MPHTHAQLDPQARLDLAQAVVAAKTRKDLTWQELADAAGLSEAFVTAALLGQHALPADAARTLAERLDLDAEAERLLRTIPLRGSLPGGVPTDPTIYRFHEMLQVYGTTLKALIHEKFGDGIISAVNFRLDVKKVADPEGGTRAVITLDGKYLPAEPF
ncbi:cyanase [Streptomyces sp. NPDC017056]|uniref:cyanase n=1 Tax=Streptomyces sp. NPDC017056 TaxID=3364973 RepID=UPI0037AB2AC9